MYRVVAAKVPARNCFVTAAERVAVAIVWRTTHALVEIYNLRGRNTRCFFRSSDRVGGYDRS